MKLKETAAANAMAVLGAIYFVGCWLIAWAMPAFYKSIAQSWAHTINLSGLWKQSQSDMLTGFISFVLISWLTGYLFAWLYNKFVK